MERVALPSRRGGVSIQALLIASRLHANGNLEIGPAAYVQMRLARLNNFLPNMRSHGWFSSEHVVSVPFVRRRVRANPLRGIR